jgi:molecular chaperone GrpE
VGGVEVRPLSMGENNVRRIQIYDEGDQQQELKGDSVEKRSQDDESEKALPEAEADLTEFTGQDRMAEEPEDWKDKYLRLAAEIDNTKKRIAKKFEIELQEKTSAVLLDILPLGDNLERILSYAKKNGDEELVRGLEITLQAFKESMVKHGVSTIDALGKLFNPDLHDAVGALHTPKYKEGTILKVERTGYLLDGRVLRPAKVIIARH